MIRICQIVPTKDHPELLRRLFESLRGQDSWLAQLVIVDGGTETRVDDVCEEYDWLPITYRHVSPPGLARQRNAGLELVADDMDVVGFWDDDLVILPGSMAAMATFWEQADAAVGGCEYNIVRDTSCRLVPEGGRRRGLLDRLFAMNPPAGTIAASGEVGSSFPATATKTVQWLCGGANLYRRAVFDVYRFDEWYNGYGVGDDVEFSARVGKAHTLQVVAEAPVEHLPLKVSGGNMKLLGRVYATNQLHFVSTRPDLCGKMIAVWSILGRGLRLLVAGVRRREASLWSEGLGRLGVLPTFALGRLKPITRSVK